MLQRPCRQVVGSFNPFADTKELEVRIAPGLSHEPRPGERFHAVAIAATQMLGDAELHQVVEPLIGKRRDPLLGPFQRVVVTTVLLQELGKLEK